MTQEPSFSDKVSDVLIKLFITGSGGSALYFLYINELPKAAIAGAVSVGAVLLTSFGEGLIATLKGGMKRQGEIVGEVTTETVGSVRDLTWARLSGLSKQYQEALKAHCYAVEVEGFQDLPGLALDDVFVPLRIESTEHRLGESDGPKEIWDFLPKRYQTPAQSPHRRMVILAAPGYGKTTLMRHLTLNLVTDPPEQVAELMPILLRFREVHGLMRLPAAGEETAEVLSLPDLVLAHLKTQPEFQKAQPTKTWLTDQLTKGTCLVMFDGLDEVPNSQRQQVRQWVDHHMKLHSASQFIITSRPHGFELSPDDPSHPITVDSKLKVLDFTPDQKQDFVEKWYRTLLWRQNWEPLFLGSQKRAASSQLSEAQARLKSDQEAQTLASDLMRQIFTTPAINDLARNPLLVTMIASTHQAQTVLPKRRVELYDKIFDLLLGTRPYAKKTPLTLTASKNKVVLQELAWRLVQAEATQFTQPQCNLWLADVLNRCTDTAWLPEQFLTEMTDIAGMIVEKERDYYEFAHQTFQEYLAAKHLREQDNGEATLKMKLTNDRWQEVTRFYAALGDATPMIEALLAEEPSEYTLLLARRCMEEGREVEQDTLAKLQDQLNTYAKAHPQATNEGADSALGDLTATLRLETRFKQPDGNPQLDPITWGEYRLFLEAQQAQQFHSTADLITTAPDQDSQPVTGISWQDARWFCAWLSTQTTLQEDGKVYDYRLPKPEELSNTAPKDWVHLAPFTTDPKTPGNTLVVVRETLPERYAALLNYLANGRWREADDETFQVMKKVAGGSLTVNAIKEFPCEDLRIIDQLWVKFSGGKFGFSVQKKIYIETGNLLNGKYREETYEKFGRCNGWIIDDKHIQSRIFDMNAPKGHLPGELVWMTGAVVVPIFEVSNSNLEKLKRNGSTFSQADQEKVAVLLSHQDL